MYSKLKSLVTGSAITAPPLPEQPALMKDAKEAMSINPSPNDPIPRAVGIPPNQYMEEDDFKRLAKRAKAMVQNKPVIADDAAVEAVKDGKSERAVPGNPVDAQNKADEEAEERDAVKLGLLSNPEVIRRHREHATALQALAYDLFEAGKYREANEVASASALFDTAADDFAAADHDATSRFRAAVEVAAIVSLEDSADVAELELLAAEEASATEVE